MQQCLVLLLSSLALLDARRALELSLNQQWQVWKKEHKRLFATEQEETKRFEIWRENLATIEQYNKQNHNFTLKMNHFGDLVDILFSKILPLILCYHMHASTHPHNTVCVIICMK